jgi:hypothetical protein
LLALAACGSAPSEAAPREAMVEVKDGLCVTKGSAAIGSRVTEPTVRAVALGSSGTAATLTFTYRGDSASQRALASGQLRRQLGLKLRAQNGCNLVYVMWRLDPRPMLEVSVKYNPGKRTHQDCGADGYTKIKAAEALAVPGLADGSHHVLRSEISGDELRAWIDDKLVWRGTLPDTARAMSGPSGFRSDNVAFDLIAFAAPRGDNVAAAPKCHKEDGD